MLVNFNIQQQFTRTNNSHTKLFNIPLNQINIQSRKNKINIKLSIKSTMLVNFNIQQQFARTNNSRTKLFNIPLNQINIQSRKNKIKFIQERPINKNSIYSTKEKNLRQVFNNSEILRKNIYTPYKEKKNYKKNYLDDSLSQLSEILDKRNLNYSGIKNKIPGINEEQNFIYNKIIKERSSINRAKILSQKIGVLKLPTTKIFSKTLTNSDREKKCFFERLDNVITIKDYSGYTEKNSNENEDMGFLGCCFGK